MQVNFNGNNKISNSTFGDHNTIYHVVSQENVNEIPWDELQTVLERGRSIPAYGAEQKKLIEEALNFVNKRDEKGIKGFIKKNKDEFFVNILSELATSGLFSILQNFCF